MTHQQIQNDKLWVKCKSGAIQQFADSSRVDRVVAPVVNHQRRALLTAAAAAAGVVVIGGVAALSPRDPVMEKKTGGGAMATFNHGGINCIEVVKLVPAYVKGTVGDEQKTDRIKEHLKVCQKCNSVYQFALDS